MFEDEGIVVPLLTTAKNVCVTQEILYCYYLSQNSVMRKSFSQNDMYIISMYEKRLIDLEQNQLKETELKTRFWYYYHLCNLKYKIQISSSAYKQKNEQMVSDKLQSICIYNNPYYTTKWKIRCNMLLKFPYIVFIEMTLKKYLKWLIRKLRTSTKIK